MGVARVAVIPKSSSEDRLRANLEAFQPAVTGMVMSGYYVGMLVGSLRVPTLEALSYAEAKQRFERNYLVGLLKMTDGNVADAARLAGRNRTEFYRLLQKNELTPGHFQADFQAGTGPLSPTGDTPKPLK